MQINKTNFEATIHQKNGVTNRDSVPLIYAMILFASLVF